MFNIALNTFKEIVRNKFLYLILFFAFVFIIFSILLWQLTLWDDNKIIVDFGLAMIEIFWIVWVLFVWSQLLFKEVEWKTIFLILSKPIKRYEFILWKFVGFSWTIFLIVLFQAILLLGVLFFKGIEIDYLIIWSLIFTFFKLEILLSLVFFLSTFMSNILTILVSMMIYFLSHSFSLLTTMAERTKNEIVVYFTQGLQLIFPPLEAINIKDIIWSFKDFHFNFFLFNTFYVLVYITIILTLTVIIFDRKKFER